MREIEFRARRIDTLKFEYGYFARIFVNGRITSVIISNGKPVHVLSQTVGEFTGSCLKSGQKIFQDDILEYEGIPHVVVLRLGCFVADPLYDSDYSPFVGEICHRCKRLGNIHENPELLS